MTGRRPDGFHNLETVFYPIGLSDILEIGEGEGKRGECTFKCDGIDVGCRAEENLIVRAYRLLDAVYRLPAVRVRLHKVIPYGAGLGGGSSDAAFMLKALNDCFGLGLSEAQLRLHALELGSDCAFFISGHPAFASGKGEVLETIGLSLETYRIVLAKPSFGVSTAGAYAGIRAKPAGFDLRRLPSLPVEEWKEVVENDFEKSVFLKYPQIADIKRQLYAAGALYASMTGSGSAVYGIFRKGEEITLDCPDCFVWQSE